MKRNKLHPHRKEQLRDDCVYVVTCAIQDCPCDGRYKNCGRGFFSLFLQVINGIDFATRHNIHYHVDFGNCIYRYSDKRFNTNNFWNYYFEQPIQQLEHSQSRVVINQFNEVYPLRIWHRSYIKYINKYIVENVRFRSEVEQFLQSSMRKLEGKKTLGMHVRLTDHKDEIAPVNYSLYLRALKRYAKKFDQLFIATDDQRFLEQARALYGTKIICNDVIRSENEEAVHSNTLFEDRYKLGLDVLADCYCLSKCDKQVLVSSNVSYVALLFNPDANYRLLERPKEKIRRWKTTALYLLDKWGIRKW